MGGAQSGHGQHAPYSTVRPSRWFATLMLAGLALALMQMDLLGIAEASGRLSYEVTSRFLSTLYPLRPCQRSLLCSDAPGRDAVAVVLLDDAFVARNSDTGTWPVRREAHAALLKRIAEAKPRAVFLDLLFREGIDTPKQRSSAGVPSTDPLREIADVLVSSRKQGVKVVMADLPATDGSLRECANGRRIVSGVTASRLACEADAVASIGWRQTDPPGIYPQEVRDEHDELLLPTPAFALLNLIRPESERVPSRPLGQSALGATNRGLLVTWGLAGNCEGAEPPDFWKRLRIGLSVLTGPSGDGKVQACHYTEHQSAQLIMEHDRLRDSLSDRIVLIGTSFTHDRDVIRNALREQVPGVMLHAMALSNLLTFDPGGYPEYFEMVAPWGGKVHTLILDGILVASVLLAWRRRKHEQLLANLLAAAFSLTFYFLGLLSLPHALFQLCAILVIATVQKVSRWPENFLLKTAAQLPRIREHRP